jgi:hypothetical protein
MHNNFGKIRCPMDKDLSMCMTNRIKKHHFPCKNTFKDKEDVELSLKLLCQRKMEKEKV